MTNDHELIAPTEPTEPFKTDNDGDSDDGKLTGLRPQDYFALGVEWEQFRQKLTAGHPFAMLAHDGHAERLSQLAKRHRRFVGTHPVRQGWITIVVGGVRASVTTLTAATPASSNLP